MGKFQSQSGMLTTYVINVNHHNMLVICLKLVPFTVVNILLTMREVVRCCAMVKFLGKSRHYPILHRTEHARGYKINEVQTKIS